MGQYHFKLVKILYFGKHKQFLIVHEHMEITNGISLMFHFYLNHATNSWGTQKGDYRYRDHMSIVRHSTQYKVYRLFGGNRSSINQVFDKEAMLISFYKLPI